MILNPRVRRLAPTRLLKLLALLLLLWTAFDVINVRRALHHEALREVPPFGDHKVFIASIHWTDERVLREHWCSAVFELAKAIGRDNVFVSIYESGSLDDSKGPLRILDDALTNAGIEHSVVLDESSHLDEVSKPVGSGWLPMPQTKSYRENWTEWFTLEKDQWVPRRIPYLARLRNQAMQPLYEQQKAGKTYSRILWLNDVVFNTDDVRNLLGTRDGEYAAACALDFKHAPAFYDTFALRDAEGFAPQSDLWPFFLSAASRSALVRAQAVPVASCWNGMVAFDASPFYDSKSPLTFRGIPDTLAAAHVEGSECCLIHADNPLSREKGVWVNPSVRVGYNGTDYGAVNSGAWPSMWAIWCGLWRNKIQRWLRTFVKQEHHVSDALAMWEKADEENVEPGSFCLIDEMQILLWNGWGHA